MINTRQKICNASELHATEHVPVVIVGAGACGLTAALTLRRLGIEPLVLEREARPTGSTSLSSGFVPAVQTQTQKNKGITDSPENFAKDIQAKAKGSASMELVEAYTSAIGPAMDALANHHGLQWELLDQFLYPGHSVHRMHAVPEKTGAALIDRLQMACEQADIMILTQALATELWVDGHQKIHGVGFSRPDGQVERIGCDMLILACNGFGGNASMVKTYLPEMEHAIFAGHAGNDGSAIAWGQLLHAATADLGGYQGHGSWAIPQGVLITWALMMEGAVQINSQGRRFHDETQGYSEASVKVLRQPDACAWNVFDNQLLEMARQFPDFIQAEQARAVKTCNDENALAMLIGCDPASLSQTLASIQPGRCSETGRLFARSLKPPFHAVKVTGALFHTQGGLDITPRCQVRRANGQPFPNLLAAGGAARGVSGNQVWGYLSGNGLLSAIAGGYISAHTAADYCNSNHLQ